MATSGKKRKARQEPKADLTPAPVATMVAMCPTCKRVVDATLSETQDSYVFQTHDIAPMCRQICRGSDQPASFESAVIAAEEVVRMTKWLRLIAFTPHLGCDKVPSDVTEIVKQVDKSIDIHGKGVNPNCGACKAQTALGGSDAP